MNNNITLAELIYLAKEKLQILNYSKGTISHYCQTWNLLKNYANSKGVSTFSLDLGMHFLSDYYGIVTNTKLPHFHVSLIRRIKFLEEFKNTSSFNLCHQRNLKTVPEQFVGIFKSYQDLQNELHYTKRTVQSKSVKVKNFLSHLKSRGILDLEKLTLTHIHDYCSNLKDYSSQTRSGILFTLRDFLKFLYSKNIISREVRDAFPVIFSNKFEKIPSFYTKTEINKLLRCVDRHTKIGKRDYAILILAIQLGIRAGDIRQLKLENIKWGTGQIEYTQQKTKIPISLPLFENIKYALLDYLKNARPQSRHTNIFVRHRAPFIQFSDRNVFYEIINKYITKAGIATDGKKHGLHSMRHSLASNLLGSNTPIHVITGILGHKDSNSTNLYLRIDIDSLRSVALEVPDGR